MGGGSTRSAYEDRYHQQFEGDLKAAGPVDRARIVAQLGDFVEDWKTGVPFQDLKGRWEFKQVGRVQSQAIMQIRVIGNYRVALMPVSSGDPRLWFLHVYRRQTTNQREIERALSRAKIILEQEES